MPRTTDITITISPRRPDRIVILTLILLSLVPAIAGMARLLELALGARITAANSRFFAMPLPVVLHIISVIPFSILGAFQFAPAFRRGNRGWHRAVGRVLIVLGMTTALSGLWMTLSYPWPEGDGELLYVERLVFGSVMLISIAFAVQAILRRDFKSHGAWMMRGYAIGMGAGTQVLTHLPWFILVGKPDELSRAFLMGLGWVVNICVAECIIRSQRNPKTIRKAIIRPASRLSQA